MRSVCFANIAYGSRNAFSFVAEQKKQVAALVVTHDRRLEQWADRVFVQRTEPIY